MYGKLISVSGNTVQITLDDELSVSRLTTLANGKQPTVELSVEDGRHITPDQRKKIYALMNDFCTYTGYVPEEAKAYFKSMVEGIFNVEPFSLSDCSVTTASYMITTILDFMFHEDIPFRTKIWDSLPSDFPRVAMCVKHRRCAICLKEHADIDHVTTVGMGRNRNKINHEGMYIEPLCRVHHTIRHVMGIKSFMQRYHLKPIKVTPELAKELHLGRLENESSTNYRSFNI
ncbi:putative HNHc nuclease [Limosilactobacillus vaginalis]|uniref:putative HNHc nuclease n=1 Tax=Limosilactobacillus vaginalis TaxID=1633 RepID=UPI0037368BE5